MLDALVYETVRHDLVEVGKLHPVEGAVIVELVFWIGNVGLRRMGRNDGRLRSLAKEGTVEGSFWHDVVVDLPSGEKFRRWKEHGNVHAILLEDAHHRDLIGHVDDPPVFGEVSVVVMGDHAYFYLYTPLKTVKLFYFGLLI